jgi:hypothetical protein
MMIDQFLKLVYWHLCLVQDDMVMDRASGALDGRVSIEIEVILKGAK